MTTAFEDNKNKGIHKRTWGVTKCYPGTRTHSLAWPKFWTQPTKSTFYCTDLQFRTCLYHYGCFIFLKNLTVLIMYRQRRIS